MSETLTSPQAVAKEFRALWRIASRMSQAEFETCPMLSVVCRTTGMLRGVPWGPVMAHCGPQGHPELDHHWHIIWRHDGQIYRDCVAWQLERHDATLKTLWEAGDDVVLSTYCEIANKRFGAYEAIVRIIYGRKGHA